MKSELPLFLLLIVLVSAALKLEAKNSKLRVFKENEIVRITNESLQKNQKNLIISRKARIGYIDVKSLRHLPMELGFVLEKFIDNDKQQKTRLKKGPKAEEIEILYNLIVVRCIATKKGSDEFDDFISGRKDMNDNVIIPFQKYKKDIRAMLITIKNQMRRKILINISREEIMHNNRWRYDHRQNKGKTENTKLSKYFDRLAKYIPDLGFSGALFELPTVGPQSVSIKLTETELDKNNKTKKHKGKNRRITFEDPRLPEDMLGEFLQAMIYFKEALNKDSSGRGVSGRIFAVKAIDSTLLAHKLLEENKEMAKFKSVPDYILVIYKKIEAIRQHIINRYYKKGGVVADDQIPKALTKPLYGVVKQEQSVKKELLLLKSIGYALEKVVLIISTAVLKIEHDKAGKSLMQSMIFQQYNYVHEFCDPPTEEEKNAFLGFAGFMPDLKVIKNKPMKSVDEVRRSKVGVYSRVQKGKVIQEDKLKQLSTRTKRDTGKEAEKKAEVDANSLMILRSVQVVTPEQKLVTVTIAYHETDLLCELVFDQDFGEYGLGGAAIFTVDTDGACKTKDEIHYFKMSKSVFDHFQAKAKPSHQSLLHEVHKDEREAWDKEHKENIIVWQEYGKNKYEMKSIDELMMEQEQRTEAGIQKTLLKPAPKTVQPFISKITKYFYKKKNL